MNWRRGRDSNPRYPFGYAGFQDRCHQPLGHLSGYYSFTTVSKLWPERYKIGRDRFQVPKAARELRLAHRKNAMSGPLGSRYPERYFVPFGYTSILLASPVFRRAMAFEKSFIGMRSVITG